MSEKIEKSFLARHLGRILLVVSVFTRASVLLLLCLFACWTEYLNLKTAYNLPRLVELSAGKTVRIFYEYSEWFFSLFGDPIAVMQTNGGMTWSIRIMGVPFTDPIAAISLAFKNHYLPLGFVLGLIIPVGIAFLFGRVFCSYVCPASLLFFTISRVRRLLAKFFYLPEFKINRGFAWGILAGGLAVALIFGHGIWTLLLPYFAIGQTLFHGIAFGMLSVSCGAILLFACIDLFLGHQFTCRYICPTGRLLGVIGRKAVVVVKRDQSQCLESCQMCNQVCPLQALPKQDNLVDCSLCGECLTICPTNCLTIGKKVQLIDV